eukprot:CAMPEP_0178909114 /NCGR_PEP_ID=MMETSP0786-20121207/8313_1 /TAXON_ID=186022 /ORGANISM="Thalassionema frauenfeldii, Strain CCMP 1798" /LENGTH=113 /DNA_ID=CAMNT_0020581121 /DNA_START=53 /DNA_END=394 /DNA_ORIENTATION=+
MADVFIPGWMLCGDESMSKWLNQYTCPGFVMCPRKSRPFGNEWHTIACVLTTIIFWAEIVKGKDHPKELGKKIKYDRWSIAKDSRPFTLNDRICLAFFQGLSARFWVLFTYLA